MISIAMATYNGEKYLREQLDSILVQTISDFELIIGDDHSTDSTVDILQEYSAKDPRIHYYVNPVNVGFKKNFEQIIGRCQGNYIALCDQDDIWYPNHLEYLLKNIGQHAMCCGNSELVDQNNQSLHRNMSDSDGINFIPKDSHKWLFRVLLHSNPFQGASMLLRADFAKRCMPIPDCMSFHDVWITGCASMDKKGLCYFLSPAITRYRQHTNNVTLGQYRDHKRSFFEKMNDYRKTICLDLIKTNRYQMCEELGKRFDAANNPYYQPIATFLSHSEQHKLTIHDIKFLWDNIENITTTKSKIGFLRKWYVWSHSVRSITV